jgi:type II secretion system (T2SS) protein M
MSLSQSLSAWFRRLSRRERRLIAAAAAVSALAILTAWVVLPLVRRWQDREVAIAARATQLGQLRTVIARESSTRRDLLAKKRARVALRQRLLMGATPALAASDVQGLLQGYADASRISLDRVDVVAEPDSAKGEDLLAIPVRLAGQGDIYGLVELLTHLQYGGKLLVIDELRVTRGDESNLLDLSLSLHGAHSQE